MVNFIYDKSPIFLQNIFISLKGLQIYKQRYNKVYRKELKTLNKADEFKLQDKRFKSFIKYTRKNSPFYSRKLSQLKKNISIDDIELLPVLTKDEIRENIDEIVTRNKGLLPMGTGGTTGKKLIVYSHPYDMSRRIAYLDHFKAQHGVKKGMKRASLGGRTFIPEKQKAHVYWRHNYVLNQLLFSIYHASNENIKYYVEELNRFKPRSIDGVTTVIFRIAKYINDHSIELSFKPIAVFPTAETLTATMKNEIEKAFKCKVYDQYSSSEGAPFIVENDEGYYDICPATGYYELERIEDNIYEIIVTSFYTTTTPLIRYRIGDAVELVNALPENYKQSDIKIKRIIGRKNDYLVSNEKGKVYSAVLSATIRKTEGNIIECQFVQNRMDEVIINFIIEDDDDKETIEQSIKELMKVRFSETVQYIVRFVKELESTESGKTRFIINNLNKELS